MIFHNRAELLFANLRQLGCRLDVRDGRLVVGLPLDWMFSEDLGAAVVHHIDAAIRQHEAGLVRLVVECGGRV